MYSKSLERSDHWSHLTLTVNFEWRISLQIVEKNRNVATGIIEGRVWEKMLYEKNLILAIS
jgi:hypothetical protein